MEVVEAIASIVGIIGVAIQALSTIDHLKDFCSEFVDQNAQDFLHDLTVSASIITDGKLLCERIRQTTPTPQVDFPVSALQIQVEDCTKDLETWLNIGKERRLRELNRYESQRLKEPNWHISLRFFKNFLDAVSRSSTMKVRDRLRWHQNNIKTTLSILGRQFDLANSARLQDVDEMVQKIRRKVSFETRLLAESLDDLSNSSSSMLAYSRTTDDRLKDVQSETSAISAEIRTLKSMLLDLSASPSVSCMYKESNELQSTVEPSSLGQSKTIGSRLKRAKNPAEEMESTDMKKVDTLEIGASTRHSTTSTTDQRYEPELETLLRATKHFVDIIQQLYHPLIAEYISTANAWKQLCCLSRDLPQGHWSGGTYITMARRKTQKMNRVAASQLLSLRKACYREGLNEILQAVDTELSIDETIIRKWTEAIEQSVRSSDRLQLESIGLSDPLQVKKDNLTGTNEWILGMFYASPSSINLHRSIYEDVISNMERNHAEIARDRERAREREAQNQGSLEHTTQRNKPQLEDKPTFLRQGNVSDAAWERMMMKFWFLDSAADEWPSGPLTATVESDATEVPFYADEGEELLNGGAEFAQPRQLVISLTYQPLKPQDIDEALIIAIDMPSSIVPPDRVAEAHLVLEAYASEPACLDLEHITNDI